MEVKVKDGKLFVESGWETDVAAKHVEVCVGEESLSPLETIEEDGILFDVYELPQISIPMEVDIITTYETISGRMLRDVLTIKVTEDGWMIM